jgi:ureidoacrylate peracid hydrolase
VESALLIIDFINDIAHPKGKIARSAPRIEKNQVLSRVNQAIDHARAQKLLLIFVKVGFHPGYIDCPLNSPLFSAAKQQGALLLDSWGTEFHEELDVRTSDLVIVKQRVSALYSTPLEPLLKAQKIERLFLAGTATNMAVEHTARDAHDRDYLVTILHDGCEAASKESHLAALETMGRFCTVVNIFDFLK